MTFKREFFALAKPLVGNYSVPSGTLCVQVLVPDSPEHLALFQGIIATLTDWQNWQGLEEDAKILAYEWLERYTLTDWEDCVIRTLVQIDQFAFNAAIIGAGSLSLSFSASLPFGYANFTPNTSGAAMKNTVWLAAGSYVYTGQSTQSTNGGNTVLLVTDQSLVTIDQIGGTIAQNGTFGTRITTTGTFDVPDDGLYEIVVANNGTGAGAGRQANWISHHIRQTG